MSDDSEPVIVEVPKAIGPPLDQLHFAVEALGDAVVFGKSPHSGERFGPRSQGLCQG